MNKSVVMVLALAACVMPAWGGIVVEFDELPPWAPPQVEANGLDWDPSLVAYVAGDPGLGSVSFAGHLGAMVVGTSSGQPLTWETIFRLADRPGATDGLMAKGSDGGFTLHDLKQSFPEGPPVPAPAAILLVGLGAGAVASMRRRGMM